MKIAHHWRKSWRKTNLVHGWLPNTSQKDIPYKINYDNQVLDAIVDGGTQERISI